MKLHHHYTILIDQDDEGIFADVSARSVDGREQTMIPTVLEANSVEELLNHVERLVLAHEADRVTVRG